MDGASKAAPCTAWSAKKSSSIPATARTTRGRCWPALERDDARVTTSPVSLGLRPHPFRRRSPNQASPLGRRRRTDRQPRRVHEGGRIYCYSEQSLPASTPPPASRSGGSPTNRCSARLGRPVGAETATTGMLTFIYLMCGDQAALPRPATPAAGGRAAADGRLLWQYPDGNFRGAREAKGSTRWPGPNRQRRQPPARSAQRPTLAPFAYHRGNCTRAPERPTASFVARRTSGAPRSCERPTEYRRMPSCGPPATTA